MGIHAPKDVNSLLAELQARYDRLLAVMQGKESSMMTISGEKPGLYVKPEAIRFAVDDVGTALKEIRSRMGKG